MMRRDLCHMVKHTCLTLKTQVNGKQSARHVDQGVPGMHPVFQKYCDSINIMKKVKKQASKSYRARDEKRRHLLALQSASDQRRVHPPAHAAPFGVAAKAASTQFKSSFSSLSMLSIDVCKDVPPMADPMRMPHLAAAPSLRVSQASADSLDTTCSISE